MYEAIVSRIKTSKHPNADRLQLGQCQGYQVVVGLDVQDNELGVFFPSDGALTDEFCSVNNLYPLYDKEGNRIGGGFIDPKNRRVRAQTFRGEKSEGFWVPLSYFSYTNYPLESFIEGATFTSINKHDICYKYVSKKTQERLDKVGVSTRRELIQLPMHLDTKHFKYRKNEIPYGAKIYITSKLHGTSGRTANAQVEKEYPWFKKIKKFKFLTRILKNLNIATTYKTYEIVTGSRRVIKQGETKGWYGSDSFRESASNLLAPYLKKGESVYYEIVGYTEDGSKIQPDMNPQVVSKDFGKEWGKSMSWDYGCLPGEFKVFIYNWLLSTETGTQYSYPWDYIKKRVKSITDPKVQLVPEVWESVEITSLYPPVQYQTNLGNDCLLDALIEELTEQPSPVGHCYQEGICLRVECQGELWGILKNKSFPFCLMEQNNKDEEVLDIEEVL